jgi:hypothetical protein
MLWQFLAMLPSAIFPLFLSFTALAIAYIRGLGENLSSGAGAEQKVTGRERPRRPNFGLAVMGLVVAFVGLGAIFLWTSYHHPILVVLAMVCIFIGLVLVAAGAGLEWFPMMGVEKWRTSRRDLHNHRRSQWLSFAAGVSLVVTE